MIKLTEQPSPHRHLEKMPVDQLTALINKEDKNVAFAIEKALPQLNQLITAIIGALRNGGRLFYLGAGSGGRLSVLDALELPTTYGIPKGQVNVILAGGVDRMLDAREDQEDDKEAGWKALREYAISDKDIVLGISASGSTPFVLAALEKCRANHITTGCLVSNPGSAIAGQADFPVEVITGPEFISGSTRMKCGTAQKMIFDMISTTTMIQLGRVEDNRMVHVQLVNVKIIDRAVKMVMEKGKLDNYEKAHDILMAEGSVKLAVDYLLKKGQD